MQIKTFASIVFCFALVLVAYKPLSAAVVDFDQKQLNLYVGQSANLNLLVNPGRFSVYTAGLGLDFNPQFVSVESFSFTPAWIALKQSGYDELNNESGRLFKTAGYPGGLNNQAVFGRLSLKAKKIGQTSLVLSGQSFTMDKDSRKQGLNTSQLSINIIDRLKPGQVEVVEKPGTEEPGKEPGKEQTTEPLTPPSVEIKAPKLTIGLDIDNGRSLLDINPYVTVDKLSNEPTQLDFFYYTADGQFVAKHHQVVNNNGRFTDKESVDLPAGVYELTVRLTGDNWSVEKSRIFIINQGFSWRWDQGFWLSFLAGLLLFCLWLLIIGRRSDDEDKK